VAVLGGAVVLWRARKKPEALTFFLALWGASHLALYTIFFRVFHQHARYVVELWVLVALLGAIALGGCRPRLRLAAGAAAVVLSVSSLGSWRTVYAANVAQVEKVGLRMAA